MRNIPRSAVVVVFLLVTLYYPWIDKDGKLGKGATLAPKDSIPSSLQQSHPGCFSGSLFSESRSLSLWETGKYVLGNQDDQANYDHLSCFLMKARYNCAKSIVPQFGEAAFHYKLTLQPSRDDNSSQASEFCDLRQLMADMADMDGPFEVLGKQMTNRGANNRTDQPTQVVLLGDSFLRQTFESLACTYRDRITSIHTQIGGPVLSIAAMQERAPDKFYTSELGVWARLNHQHPQGCHSGLESRYYEENITVPEYVEGCNDDVASVVFDEVLEFIYIFRPNLYGDQTALLDFAGVDTDRVHTVVRSKGFKLESETMKMLRGLRFQDWDLVPFRKLEERDLHRWFGADNPGMFAKPDIHGCMPGVPDDEANLLLYSLLANVIVKFEL